MESQKLNSIISIRKQLQSRLSPSRFEHSLSVSFTNIALAMRYGYNLEYAELAGLLHDCAKYYTDAEIIKKCSRKGISISDIELQASVVLHAKYGAWMAEHKYQITSPEITNAIRWHTTGRPDMSLPEKLLYVSDYIESRRDKANDLPLLRKQAFIDLDETIYCIMQSTLDYLSKKGGFVDPMTYEAYQYYKRVNEERKGELNGTI